MRQDGRKGARIGSDHQMQRIHRTRIQLSPITQIDNWQSMHIQKQ